MTADFDVILNFNSATPVKTGAEFKAGDKGFTINMTVKELDPTGMTPKIAFYRANGTSVESSSVTNVGNVYSYTLLGNELAVPGVVVADLKFYDGDDQRVSSASFIFTAIADTLDGLGGGTESYSDELEQLSAEFQDTLDDYIDAFGNTAPINPRGDYDNTATYEPRDMVYDSNTGTSWVCKQESTGNAPTNGSAYWQKLVNGAGSMNFDDLADVNMTGVQDGQVPAYDANSGTYKPVTPSPGGVTSFNNRTGAVTPAAGDYDLAGLSDTNVSTPSDGQLLGYNGANGKWENVDKPVYSNPNLLINGWFTVNQRGWTSGSSTWAKYCADRWKMYYGTAAGTVAVTSNGISLSPASSDNLSIIQPFEDVSPLSGKTLTFSAALANGTVYKGTVQNFNTASNTTFVSEDSGKFVLRYTASDNSFRIQVYDNYTIRAVKLEIGSTSTLALDAPPEYCTELLKCQRYFRRINSGSVGFGFANNTTTFTLFIPQATYMRVFEPTLTTSGTLKIYNQNQVVTGIGIYYADSQLNLLVGCTTSGLTAGSFDSLDVSSGGYIDLDAEL